MTPSKIPPPKKHQLSADELKRQFRFSLWFIPICLIGVYVFNALWAEAPPEAAPFSRLLDGLDSGQVTEATIGPETIVWRVGEGDESVRFRATRVPGVDDAELVARLHEIDATFTGEVPSRFWSSILAWVFPLMLLGLIWFWGMRRLPGSTQALSFGSSRAKIWDESSTRVTFEDVAGVDEAVTELQEVVDFMRRPEKYTSLGAHVPKGVLLVGPPGTGKTLLARATAGEAGVPFFSISGADFVEMFVGVGAARVRDLFRQARERAPCIVFVDEIDTIGKSRAGPGSPISNDEREQTLNQLLVEMDGFDSSTGVIMMAATNRPDLLDPALQRPGRFDRQISVDRPDLKGRDAILKVHASTVTLAPDVDLRGLAARTPGFAGAQLANVINEGALLAVRAGRQAVTMGDLDEAVDRVMAGLERKSRALNTKEKKIVAHHEMGHALMGMLLPYGDPVHKVSIVPRGTAALGVTIQTPLEDRYLLTEAELRDRLTVLLGGRAAESVVFGDVSTGAADDLLRATALARKMVTEFGMTDDIGPVAVENMDEDGSTRSMLFTQRQYSEHTARQIDNQVKRIIEESYEQAQSLLEQHKPALLELATDLVEQEVMGGEELAERLKTLGLGTRLPIESGPELG